MFLAFAAAVFFCCEGTPRQKLAAAVLTAGPAFSVNVLTDNYFLEFNLTINGMRSVPLPGYWEIRLGYWAVMCLLARKLLAGQRQELPGKFWNLLILLSAPVFGMLGALVIFSDQEIGNAWRDISISALCMLYWIGMILTVHVLGRQQELERKEHFYQMRQQYYNAMERQQKEVRRLRHDMKNHLTALSGLSGEAEKAYLTELLNAPALSPGRTYCENRTAIVVLSAKADQALEQETEFEVHAMIPESIPVDPMDLCSLLGNVLDNALEAAARMPREQRRVSFSAGVEKGLLLSAGVRRGRPPEGICCLRTRSRSENNAAVHRRPKGGRQVPALFYGPQAVYAFRLGFLLCGGWKNGREGRARWALLPGRRYGEVEKVLGRCSLGDDSGNFILEFAGEE